MKKYVIFSLCLMNTIEAMDQPKREPREWLSQEYSESNESGIACFRHWLNEYDIETTNKTIISFCCGTGEIEEELAKKATHVYGIDASKNQIEFAQKRFENVPKPLFQHCFAEDFSSPRLHDLAIASFCFNYFTDKKVALKRIYDSLEVGGQFFANIQTTDNPIPFHFTVFEEMKTAIPMIGSALSNLPGISRMTDKELKNMLSETGFKILKAEEKSYDWTKTEEQWRKFLLPLMLSSPGAQASTNVTSKNILNPFEMIFSFILETNLTEKEKIQHAAPFFPESKSPGVQTIRNNDFYRYLFNNFLNRCLTKLHDNGNGTYTYTYVTTIILAKKN